MREEVIKKPFKGYRPFSNNSNNSNFSNKNDENMHEIAIFCMKIDWLMPNGI